MNIIQIQKKVKESGPVRAYLTLGSIEQDDLFYRGQRGTLIVEGGFLFFYSDANSDLPMAIEASEDVHCPKIGHHQWT